MNSPVVLGLIILGLMVAGCDSKKPAAKTQPNPGSGNPALAPLDYLEAQGKAKKYSERTISTAQITQAIQQFNAMEDRFPKNLNELAEKHYLQSAPVAPQGYRFDYDPATGEFKMVRQ